MLSKAITAAGSMSCSNVVYSSFFLDKWRDERFSYGVNASLRAWKNATVFLLISPVTWLLMTCYTESIKIHGKNNVAKNLINPLWYTQDDIDNTHDLTVSSQIATFNLADLINKINTHRHIIDIQHLSKLHHLRHEISQFVHWLLQAVFHEPLTSFSCDECIKVFHSHLSDAEWKDGLGRFERNVELNDYTIDISERDVSGGPRTERKNLQSSRPFPTRFCIPKRSAIWKASVLPSVVLFFHNVWLRTSKRTFDVFRISSLNLRVQINLCESKPFRTHKIRRSGEWTG